MPGAEGVKVLAALAAGGRKSYNFSTNHATRKTQTRTPTASNTGSTAPLIPLNPPPPLILIYPSAASRPLNRNPLANCSFLQPDREPDSHLKNCPFAMFSYRSCWAASLSYVRQRLVRMEFGPQREIVGRATGDW
jgi:hypothetical protein